MLPTPKGLRMRRKRNKEDVDLVYVLIASAR